MGSTSSMVLVFTFYSKLLSLTAYNAPFCRRGMGQTDRQTDRQTTDVSQHRLMPYCTYGKSIPAEVFWMQQWMNVTGESRRGGAETAVRCRSL